MFPRSVASRSTAGAEALLARRPEGVELITALGAGRRVAAAGPPRRRASGRAARSGRCRNGSSWGSRRTSMIWRPRGLLSPAGLARGPQGTRTRPARGTRPHRRTRPDRGWTDVSVTAAVGGADGSGARGPDRRSAARRRLRRPLRGSVLPGDAAPAGPPPPRATARSARPPPHCFLQPHQPPPLQGRALPGPGDQNDMVVATGSLETT